MQKSTYTFRAATNRDAVAIQKLVFSVLNSYGLTPDPEGTDTDLNNLEQTYYLDLNKEKNHVEPR